jgi:hypothetical protein
MKTVMRIAGCELLILWRSGVGVAAMLMALLFSSLAIFQGVERTGQERAAVQRFKESDESRLAVYQKRAATMEQQLANGGNRPDTQSTSCSTSSFNQKHSPCRSIAAQRAVYLVPDHRADKYNQRAGC